VRIAFETTGLNDADGIVLDSGSDGSVVRGLEMATFREAIRVSSNNNQVSGNLFVSKDAKSWFGNTIAIGVYGSNNIIGATSAQSVVQHRNVISGGGYGILLSGENASKNHVRGNLIGLDPLGTAKAGNAAGVVIVNGANTNVIGSDTVSVYRNVISGNAGSPVALPPEITFSGGVVVGGSLTDLAGSQVSDNAIVGNQIGVDPLGNTGIPNSVGVRITGAAGTRVTNNVITGSMDVGIYLSGGTDAKTMEKRAADGTVIKGNIIGLNWSGDELVQNSNTNGGILIGSDVRNTTIGGPGQVRNTISGNGNYGIRYFDTDGKNNRILENYIGVS